MSATEKFQITREIGIDMGHRVTHHGSKCRNLHGHRYTIQATVTGTLFTAGEQEGMVLDYGFLKELMMLTIDHHCDHGMCLWEQDPWVQKLVGDAKDWETKASGAQYDAITLSSKGSNLGGKYYIVPFVPTAENLAKHWFERLEPLVVSRTKGQGVLQSVRVWETPNCQAIYERPQEK